MRTYSTFLLLVICLLLISACENEKSKDLEQLEALEAAIEAGNPTNDQVESLTEKYMEYLDKYPDDAQTNSSHFYSLALLQSQNERFSTAAEHLKHALRDHYVKKSAAAQVQFLATLYTDHLNNPEAGQAAYMAFTEAFPDNAEADKIKDSLLVGVPSISDQLDSLQSQLYNDQENKINYNKANRFIDVSEIYALALPENEQSPDMLAEAAKVAGYVNAFPRALGLYEWIYKKYPDHEKAGQALFMMGFINDNEIGEKEKAKAYYQDFIDKYPNDDFVDDAQFLLQNLDKSNEEIINSFGE